MKSKNWLSDLLEETMYEHYLESYPAMVAGIKKLLIAGENPAKIKRFCEGVAGRSMTSNCVGHMIDYVNKQVKN
jgi:hypothetical protein